MHSTREASVTALVHMVARHKLYEKHGVHDVYPEVQAWERLSVTCTCGRHWFLLDADVEPKFRILFEYELHNRFMRLVNLALASLRWALLHVAPHRLELKEPTRFDRDPPV